MSGPSHSFSHKSSLGRGNTQPLWWGGHGTGDRCCAEASHRESYTLRLCIHNEMPSNTICSCFICCSAASLTFLDVGLLLPVPQWGADCVERGKWGLKPTQHSCPWGTSSSGFQILYNHSCNLFLPALTVVWKHSVLLPCISFKCGTTRSNLSSGASFLCLVHSDGLHFTSALLSKFPLQPIINTYRVENLPPKPFRLMLLSVILGLRPRSKSKNLQFASHSWKADWHLGGSLRSCQEGWDPWKWICRPVRNYQPLQHVFVAFIKKCSQLHSHF